MHCRRWPRAARATVWEADMNDCCKQAARGGLLGVALAAVLAGCAVDDARVPAVPEAPARLVTQSAPSTDYTVFYWSALRACLQTGRSEWECKSGEDGFVRDALAVETVMEAQRRQRRLQWLARADIERDDAPAGPERAAASARHSQSLVFEKAPEWSAPAPAVDLPPWLDLTLATGESAATTR